MAVHGTIEFFATAVLLAVEWNFFSTMDFSWQCFGVLFAVECSFVGSTIRFYMQYDGVFLAVQWSFFW